MYKNIAKIRHAADTVMITEADTVMIEADTAETRVASASPVVKEAGI